MITRTDKHTAILRDGTKVSAIGGVYMRPVVQLDAGPDESVHVRSGRWVRYRVLPTLAELYLNQAASGAVKMTGRGVSFEEEPALYNAAVARRAGLCPSLYAAAEGIK